MKLSERAELVLERAVGLVRWLRSGLALVVGVGLTGVAAAAVGLLISDVSFAATAVVAVVLAVPAFWIWRFRRSLSELASLADGRGAASEIDADVRARISSVHQSVSRFERTPVGVARTLWSLGRDVWGVRDDLGPLSSVVAVLHPARLGAAALGALGSVAALLVGVLVLVVAIVV